MSDVQYICTKRELTFQDCSGRHTIFDAGVPGFVLSIDRIDSLFDATEKQQSECFRMLENARDLGKTLVLIQGRPCVLDDGDFILCDAPKMYPIPNEIF